MEPSGSRRSTQPEPIKCDRPSVLYYHTQENVANLKLWAQQLYKSFQELVLLNIHNKTFQGNTLRLNVYIKVFY